MDIMAIGEAWGEHEERQRAPFVGPSGYFLTNVLGEAGIRRSDCYLTNVFNLRPPNNKIEALCGPKSTGVQGYPSLVKAKYLRNEFIPELDRLGQEVIDVNPNVIIALGNTALWALCGVVNISKVRGTTRLTTHLATGYKLLPTYHPAAVLRQMELRPVVISDLIKAWRESKYPEIRRPKREIWIEPTIEDLEEFYERHIRGCKILSIDIETAGESITCVGFAPNHRTALVIPFTKSGGKGGSYWTDQKDERQAWGFINRVLKDGRLRKVLQNGLYDIAFLYRAYGIRVVGAEHDTMLLHHALQPESLKGLGFLGSIYTDEGAWKQMREKKTTIKKDD